MATRDLLASESGAWRGTISASCATLLGIGLARFAYTPLIPVLVTQRWFGASDAAYLGAANLAGYLVGALSGRSATGRVPVAAVLRTAMILSSLTFFACAVPNSFGWFFAWRFLGGLSGGVLMVVAAPSVLPSIPPARRGIAGGVIFAGVGLGIVLSGTLVPLLMRWGLTETWLGLGTMGAILTITAWYGWPGTLATALASDANQPRRTTPRALKVLYVEYALNAAGLVPHMVFLVDFIARGIGMGLEVSAAYWIIFGFGALLAPACLGALADRFGFGTSLRLAYIVQALSASILLMTTLPVGLALSSFITGAFVPGITTIVLGRIRELTLADLQLQKTAWAYATTAFSIGQAAAAYGFSAIFAHTGSYALLYAASIVAFGAALSVNLWRGAVVTS